MEHCGLTLLLWSNVALSACGCRGVAQEASLVWISSVCGLWLSVWRPDKGGCQPDRQARVNGTEFQATSWAACGAAFTWRWVMQHFRPLYVWVKCLQGPLVVPGCLSTGSDTPGTLETFAGGEVSPRGCTAPCLCMGDSFPQDLRRASAPATPGEVPRA